MSTDSEMAQVLAQLSVLSEVSAPSYEPSVHGGTPDRSPKGPNRGLADEYHAEYVAASSSAARSLVLTRARRALGEARRRSLPSQEPDYGSAQWKRWVAESSEDGGELARRFNVTRQYIGQIRKAYREAAA